MSRLGCGDSRCTRAGFEWSAADGTLRFRRAEGRAIPRFGYHTADFMADSDEKPSREHYCPEISENRFNWLRVSTVSGCDSIS